MNVFILSTGRCGSLTFSKACEHIRNYTSAHESRVTTLGPERLHYPDNHIESDNRLCWFLGRLDERYGDSAFYVHLKRDPAKVAASYSKRFKPGNMMMAYISGIYLFVRKARKIDVAQDYVETANANIDHFLKDKTRKMEINLETVATDFPEFWQRIGAEGDLAAAMGEFSIAYNATRRPPSEPALKP